MFQGPFRITFRIAEILEDVGVPYFLGGSLASSMYGEPRTTHDIDIVADFRPNHVPLFLKIVKDEFHAPEAVIQQAVRESRFFNIIHKEESLKIDFYPLRDDAFARAEMERRVKESIPEAENRVLWIASPEDVVLSKLRWYVKGHRVSSQQWRDVLGVLKQQAPKLDCSYMMKTAAILGLANDLLRALEEAGISPPTN